jgi:hypothetical protein
MNKGFRELLEKLDDGRFAHRLSEEFERLVTTQERYAQTKATRL